MTDTRDQPEFVDIEVVAKELHLHHETIRRACVRGDIPGGIKIGGSWRVHLPSLREAARQGTLKGVPGSSDTVEAEKSDFLIAMDELGARAREGTRAVEIRKARRVLAEAKLAEEKAANLSGFTDGWGSLNGLHQSEARLNAAFLRAMEEDGAAKEAEKRKKELELQKSADGTVDSAVAGLDRVFFGCLLNRATESDDVD